MLEGEIVRLRGWRECDVQPLLSLRENIGIQVQLMSQPRAHDVDRTKRWLINKSEATNSVFFIIADQVSDSVVGYLQYCNIDTLHGHAELGICILPTYHGKGYGSESLKLSENYIKSVFRVRKIILKVLLQNSTAVHVYKKNGFLKCGLHQQHYYLNGKFRDVVVMEKILEDSDW